MKYTSGRRRDRLFRGKVRRPLLPISLIVVVLIILAFSLIQPFNFITDINPGNVKVPTFTPTATPLPGPTDVHGGHVVFTCSRKDVNQICVIRADSASYAQLTDGTANSYYPAISPDGQSVVFAQNKYDDFDLFSFRFVDADLTQLTDQIGNSFSPDFSPDGSQILFLNKVGDKPSAIWVMGRKGEKPHVLYQAPKDIVGADWSPDGRTIAFTMSVDVPFTYEVFLISVDHLQDPPKQITHGLPGIGGSLDWSPDGKHIAIFAGPVDAREIYTLDVGTGAVTQLTHGGNNASPSYSPDGFYIVYNSLRNNGQADLYLMRSDGHSTRQLTNNPEPDWQPQWGP